MPDRKAAMRYCMINGDTRLMRDYGGKVVRFSPVASVMIAAGRRMTGAE